jgi:hypothetical protein
MELYGLQMEYRIKRLKKIRIFLKVGKKEEIVNFIEINLNKIIIKEFYCEN